MQGSNLATASAKNMTALLRLAVSFCLLTEAFSQTCSCPDEDTIIRNFNQASRTLEVKGCSGKICHMQDYHYNGNADDDGEDYNEDYDTMNCSSCESVYKLCRLSLNITTTDCLDEHCSNTTTESSQPISSAQAYGYGFLMICFVSLCSLVGVFLVPIINSQSKFGRKTYEYVYAFMIAIGISALLSDAVLHLIPHSFDLGHGKKDSEGKEFLWKGSIILLGGYAFFLLEVVLHGMGDCIKKKSEAQDQGHICTANKDGHYSSNLPEIKEIKTEQTVELSDVNNNNQPVKVVEDQVDIAIKIKQIKPVAWLIIIGDAMHNFADGLALGAAIVESLTLGISTMLALVFHEVPHELGDYVVLIKSGMHWGVALLFNFFSSLTAIIGFFVGVAVSSNSKQAKSWILALTAGLFLYISLTDLLPELIHGGGNVKMTKTKTGWTFALRLVLVNLGFFLSFALLLTSANYEESMNKLIK